MKNSLKKILIVISLLNLTFISPVIAEDLTNEDLKEEIKTTTEGVYYNTDELKIVKKYTGEIQDRTGKNSSKSNERFC